MNAESLFARVPSDAALSSDAESFTITDLAAAFNVTPRAIRFYEDQGLISPQRQGQNRVYSRRDRARLAWILRGKRVGFSLAEIREMLDLYDAGDGRARQRKLTIARCRDRIDVLAEQRADIDDMIDELERFVGMLETMASPGQSTGA
jgi:DNA-binding transcriptional MerR regulator